MSTTTTAYTVDAIADGAYYFDPRTFDGEYTAAAYFDSTCDRIRREDGPDVDVEVRMFDAAGDIMFARHFPAAY